MIKLVTDSAPCVILCILFWMKRRLKNASAENLILRFHLEFWFGLQKKRQKTKQTKKQNKTNKTKKQNKNKTKQNKTKQNKTKQNKITRTTNRRFFLNIALTSAVVPHRFAGNKLLSL